MSESIRQPSNSPTALVRHPDGWRWWQFATVRDVVRADSLAEVPGVLAAAEAAASEGYWAVGFCAYEAAPAFDQALEAHAGRSGEPLAWFALCGPPREVAPEELPDADAFEVEGLRPTVGPEEHALGVESIRRWIAAGETYQVNYTHHLEGRFEGDPWGFFLALDRGQRSPYALWLDTGSDVVCSTSPELFFDLDGERLVARPMKGTAPRGRTTTEDASRADALARSSKDRAENVMIVDMIRNDLGRIAEPGSVETTRLLDVERYETVFQMTSTIEARTRASVAEIFAALFPCASITGAPKVRTSQLIRQLEVAPRGVYTGALGWLAPNRRARFSVAIRTATLSRAEKRLRYGTGGGIVWDSNPEAEYAECADKARILTAPRPEFELLETLLWQPDGGFALLDRHLDRLADSAAYFDFEVASREELSRRLLAAGREWTTPRKVRLLVSRDGAVRLESSRLGGSDEPPTLRLAVASRPIDSRDPFLCHKTTHRPVYERARAEHPAADDVLLWNERGELTESTLANVILDLGGELCTPPVACGLLAGTLRAELLAEGSVRERILTLDDLADCTAIYLANSVRGHRRATLVNPLPTPAPRTGSDRPPG